MKNIPNGGLIMQIQLKILNSGDEVLNTWDNKISIKRQNGEVEIYSLNLDDDGLPRLEQDTILITFGNGEVLIKNKNKRKNKKTKNTSEPDDDVEIMTF